MLMAIFGLKGHILKILFQHVFREDTAVGRILLSNSDALQDD